MNASPAPPSQADLSLTAAEQQAIDRLNCKLHEVYYRKVDRVTRDEVLREYVALKLRIVERGLRFGIINNRILVNSKGALVPFISGNTLLIYEVVKGASNQVGSRTVHDGTIVTDRHIHQLAEFKGKVVDLETDLFDFDISRCQVVRVGHIRDMAAQLESMAQSANLAESTFLLRTLVAQTSLLSFKEYLRAKNLQAEVRRLQDQLLNFLNSPLSYRLPFLIRILVRNISSVVAKPKLIDRLWNDTIDLAEVHLRGSQIVNEIRRSTHHAVGNRTLVTVQSYLDYLETGNCEGLVKLGYPEPGLADQLARKKKQPKRIVARILSDLKELLGNADVLNRIDDWQARYASALFRCESDESMADELELAVTDGIRDRNRWMFYHHIRIIRNRVSQFNRLPGAPANVERLNQILELEPDEPGVDTSAIELQLRECVGEFTRNVQAVYQESPFRELKQLTATFKEKNYYDSFVEICELRKRLRGRLIEGAFPEQRLLSYELDCLLEEISFVALRHIAGSYDENGTNITQCLDIIKLCAVNLTHDGLHSRQLLDLVDILGNRSHTFAELTNILQQIQRNYQHIIRQLALPFEQMKGELKVDEKELRIALANMQRFLHDLNSMAAFADTALSYIEYQVSDPEERIGPRATESRQDDEEDGIIHLSHQAKIRTLVREPNLERNLRTLYGGKGSGLLYISYLNIPTSDGFILPTTLSRRCSSKDSKTWLDELLHRHLARLETDIGQARGQTPRYGNPANPLLLAVRGGSVFSMPGILSSVLFVGMNDEIAASLAKDDPWNAYDSYRRFLASYAQATWGVDVEKYNLVEKAKTRKGVKYKEALPWESMREVVEATKDVIRDEGFGEALEITLSDLFEQLSSAVLAVMGSWNHPNCQWYRELKGICDSWNTAVTIQEMSFGNRKNKDIRIGMDESKVSLTGVIPRSMITEYGFHESTGEFKFSACGEDLVGGLTTTMSFLPFSELKTYLPMLDRRLYHKVARLRSFMGTDQEIEFTVDRGILSVLQSRAAVMGENIVDRAFLDPGQAITRGLGIRGSAFRGLIAFDEADHDKLRQSHDLAGRDDVDGILLILENPTPTDIPLVLSADGLLASKGGSTSHAAVAIHSIEQKDYCAVMSASRLRVNADSHEAVVLDSDDKPVAHFHTGDIVSINGTTGEVYVGTKAISSNGQ
jgi:hypothetical protein